MIIGLDLGTRHLGVVVAGDAIPLQIVDASTPAVNPHDLDATAREVRVLVDRLAGGALPPGVVVELGALYIPLGSSPQKAQGMAEAHATMGRLLDRIYEAVPGPYYRVVTIARRTWSSRVVPHHMGGVSNAEARAGLGAWLDPSSAWSLVADQHRADACGAILGWLLGPASRPYVAGRRRNRRSKIQPRTIARHRHSSHVERLADAAAARLAAAASAMLHSGPRHLPTDKRQPRPLPAPLPPCSCGPRGSPRGSASGPHARHCARVSSPVPWASESIPAAIHP